MKRYIILLLFVSFATVFQAQTSRRAIKRYATEAVKQISLTGRTPTIDVLDSLANNAEVSVEMLSRMGDPDDVRQQRACLRLIDDIVAYSMQPTGMRYVDVVRKGLKKALDRSYDTDVQRHVMEQLALCAKPADAPHVAMYLEVEPLRPTAHDILVSMADIDDMLASIASDEPAIAAYVKDIISIRAGKASSAVQPVVERPKPVAVPLWTESLEREVESMCRVTSDAADSVIIRYDARESLPMLLCMARRADGEMADRIVAKAIMVAQNAFRKQRVTGEEYYVLLREADALTTNDILRQKIILSLGETHSVQAFAYMRRHYGKAQYGDALALAVVDILSVHPEANCGKLVNSMLYAAKQSFIRHYDEQGVDTYIDLVLAAIDNWHADGGYDLAHTEDTRMGGRGFWVIHEDMKDATLLFDCKAQGTLTLLLGETPLLLIDHGKGVRLCGEDTWHGFDAMTDWMTASVDMTGGKVSVMVNGHKLIDDVRPAAGVSGYVKFLADDKGASVRQYMFRRP